MTRIEYDLLREERPELKLPTWDYCYRSDYLKLTSQSGLSIELALPCTRDELIAHRAAMLLVQDEMPKGTL